jgi:hypothetical protein
MTLGGSGSRTFLTMSNIPVANADTVCDNALRGLVPREYTTDTQSGLRLRTGKPDSRGAELRGR